MDAIGERIAAYKTSRNDAIEWLMAFQVLKIEGIIPLRKITKKRLKDWGFQSTGDWPLTVWVTHKGRRIVGIKTEYEYDPEPGIAYRVTDRIVWHPSST